MSQHESLEKAASPSSDLSQDPVDSSKPQTPSLDLQRSSDSSKTLSEPETPEKTAAKDSATDPKSSEPSSKRHTINFSRPIPIMTGRKTTVTSYSAKASPPNMKRGSPEMQYGEDYQGRLASYPYAPRSDSHQTPKRARTSASMAESASSDFKLTAPAQLSLERTSQLQPGNTKQLPSSMGASGMVGYPPPMSSGMATQRQESFNPSTTSSSNSYSSYDAKCLLSPLQPQLSARAYEKMPENGPTTKQVAPMMPNYPDFKFTPPTSTGLPDCARFPGTELPQTKRSAPYEGPRIAESRSQRPYRAPAKPIHKTPETHGTWEKSPYGIPYGPERRDGRLRTPEWYRQQGYYVDEEEDEAPPAKNPNFGGLPRNIDLVARENRKKKAADPNYVAPTLEESMWLLTLEERRETERKEEEADAERLRQQREKKHQKQRQGGSRWVAVEAERRRRREFQKLVEQYERECPYISALRPSNNLTVRSNSAFTSERSNGKMVEVGGNWTIIEVGDDPFVSKDPEGDSNMTMIDTIPKEQTSKELQNSHLQQPTEAKDVFRGREDTLALYRRQKEAWAKEDGAAAAEAKVDWHPLTTDKAIWEQQKQLEMWNRRKAEQDGSVNAPPTPKSDASSGVREQQSSGSLDFLPQKTKERFAKLATEIHEQSRSTTDKMMDGAMDMHIGETQLRSDTWREDHGPKTSAKKPPSRIILKVGGVKKARGTKENPIILEAETGNLVASEEEIAEQQMLLDMHKRRHEELKNNSQTFIQPDTKENNIPTDNGDGWLLIRGQLGYKEETHSPRLYSPSRPVYFQTDSESAASSSISSSGDTPQTRSPMVPAFEMRIQADSPTDTASTLACQLKGQAKSSESCFWTPDRWLSGQDVPEGIQDPVSEGFADEWTPTLAPPSDTRIAIRIAKTAWSTHMAGKPKQTPNKEKMLAEQAEVIPREHRKSQTDFMLSPAACLSDEDYCKIWAEWARLTRIKRFRASDGGRLPEDEGLCEGMLEAFLEMMTRVSVGASASQGQALKNEYHRFNAAPMLTMNKDQVMQDGLGSTSNGPDSSSHQQGPGSEDDGYTILNGQPSALADTSAITQPAPHEQLELKAEWNPPPRVRLVKEFIERGSLQRLDRKTREYYSTLMNLVQEQRTAQVDPQHDGDTQRTARASNGTQEQGEAPTVNKPAGVMRSDSPSLGVPVSISPVQAQAIEFFRRQMEAQEDKEGWIKLQAGLIAMMQQSQETKKKLEESAKRLNKTRAQFREQWGDETSTDEDPYPEDNRLERMGGRKDAAPTTDAMWWDTNATRQNAQIDLRHARAELFDLLWRRRSYLEREQEASWANKPASPYMGIEDHRIRRDLGRVKRLLTQLNIARSRLDPPEECVDLSDGDSALTLSAFGSDEDKGGGDGTGKQRLGYT
ncbi:hypothetical protein PpBr36_04985 [Pyricularia pennisetigena]|uniref:hypothetical protein n=1 Tax=Pyricularia pennisetigena TaxID=1578925 RepID=UPI00114E9152|nr:hypothetical protein PpBr36_04985 [Pyricularia pennisetigena]TLS26130.1 hypothetical protein PpBr36_04985 [Pyricularia pennisetigena]